MNPLLCARVSRASETRSRQRQRTLDARAADRRSKAWASELAAINMTGMLWRRGSVWIDQSDGTQCVEFIHVENGKSRVVRVCPRLYPCPDTRRGAILQQLGAPRG